MPKFIPARLAVSLTILAALVGIAGMAPTPASPPNPTPFLEPLPTLGVPLDPAKAPELIKELQQFAQVKESVAVWAQVLDLDADGKEDAIFTMALPDEPAGARGRTRVRVTYIFRGNSPGSFGGSISQARLWFSLDTEYYLNHLEGDVEIKRTFCVQQSAGHMVVVVREYTYETGPGDGTTRCNHLVASSEKQVNPENLRADPKEFQ